MARARNIKPGLYKNEDLAECSVWARYIFPGLWMLADREGRLEDRPRRIKGELLPFDAQDVEPLLRELAGRGFIVRYQNEGASFIQISKFKEHQTPHYSEKPSAIKGPPFQENGQHICNGNSENSHPSSTGNSGNSPPIKRGSQPPDSLIPDSLIPDSPKKTSRAKVFALPSWIPEDAWNGWLEMRKKKRVPETQRALEIAVGRLEKLREAGEDVREVLDNATYRGWQGLFPPGDKRAVPDYSRVVKQIEEEESGAKH